MRVMAVSLIQILFLIAVFFGMDSAFMQRAYEENLEQSLTAALRHVLTASCIQEDAYLDTEEALYGELIGELSVSLLEAESYEITIYRLDMESAEADVRVTVPIRDYLGNIRRISARKHAVVQQHME